MSDKTLSTKLAGWTDPALATRIRQYRKEGKNARPYVAELNRRLRALAHTAIGSCVAADVKELAETPDASSWRVIAQDACEEFFELANAQLTEKQEARLIKLCEKANPQCVVHTLRVLGAKLPVRRADKLAVIVALLDAECARLHLDAMDSEQIDCLRDPERREEAEGMLDDLEARVGLDVTVARELWRVL